MKLKKYLTESYGDIDIPGFKQQHLKCCSNCEHFVDMYGEEFFCGNPEYQNSSKYDTYQGKPVGVPLVLNNIYGICPKYKEDR